MQEEPVAMPEVSTQPSYSYDEEVKEPITIKDKTEMAKNTFLDEISKLSTEAASSEIK